MENQDALKWLFSVILWAASSLRLLIFSLPLAIAVLLILQFRKAACTSTWVLWFLNSEFHLITSPLKTQLNLSTKYLDLSIILASEALYHPKVHIVTELISTLLKLLCKPSDSIMPLSIFLLGLLQLDIWKTCNGPMAKLGEGPAAAHVKAKKIAVLH